MWSSNIVLLTLLTLVLGSPPKSNERNSPPPPEVGLELEELVEYYGYSVETHQIQTEDGYILNINHILPVNPNAPQEKGVALLVPCLLCSATAFVINANRSLGLQLTAAGYDVWLLNYRGTTYSRKHTTLDPNEPAFWDFSFHEIGYYDVPAAIDFVLGQTGQEQLFYVGHSQGTADFFALASTRPEYNARIRLAVTLAPIAFMGNTRNPLLQFLAENNVIGGLLTALDMYEVLPHWDVITDLGLAVCTDDSPLQGVCAFVLSAVSGFNYKELNQTMIPVITSTFPAGTSRKQLLHLQQEMLSGNFQQYDYGQLENLLRYGSVDAPIYDLKKITSPVALFYGANDMLDNPVNVEKLAEELPNVVLKHLVEDEEFGHLDFLWAVHLDTLVNNHVIDVMGGY